MVGAAALALLRPMRLKGAKPSLSAAAPSGESAAYTGHPFKERNPPQINELAW